MVIAPGREERRGARRSEEGEVVGLIGEPGRSHAAARHRQLDPLGGEHQIIGADDALQHVDPFGGLGGGVLMEQDDMRAARHLGRNAEGPLERLEVGVVARLDQASQRGDHPSGRGVRGVGVVSGADHRDGLGGQAVLQGPPGGRGAGLDPARQRRGAPRVPLPLRPVAGDDLAEIAPGECADRLGSAGGRSSPRPMPGAGPVPPVRNKPARPGPNPRPRIAPATTRASPATRSPMVLEHDRRTLSTRPGRRLPP